jgi:hypothetical protein
VRRWQAARRQRGAAVMLVVLTLTMLMGIGLFAARTAQLSIAASGYDRQMTQTHYITQHGVNTATGELSSGKAAAYLKEMSKPTPDPNCSLQAQLSQKLPNYTCYRFFYSDLQSFVGQPFMPGGGQSTLGNVNVEPDWLIEMSDLAPAAPVAGMDLTSAGASNLGFRGVTFTATGKVRPVLSGPVPTLQSSASTAIETQRAHLIVGPVPLH